MTTYIKKDFASPNGPILLLSAKGSTTAGIAAANGVKDFSGNGNHGQAGSGVSVVNNEERGFCFSFDRSNNTASKLTFGQNLKTSTTTGLTISVRFLATEVNILQILFDNYSSGSRVTLVVYENNDFGWTGCGIADHRTSEKIEANKWYEYTVVYGDEGAIKAYLNSELIDSVDMPDGADNPTLIGNSYVGNRFASNNLGLKGLISNVRIYPRALSAAEVKYLYNGFQPNIIVGQTIPSGAILDLSARGLTTAGIAQANGVVDRSGNGNHGQAYNGVAVVNDDEMGSCFSFDGSNDVIAIGSNNLSSYFNDMEEMSLSLLLRVNAVTTSSQYLVSFKTQVSDSNQSWICLWIDAATNKISFTGRWKESDVGNPWTGSKYFLTANLGTVYHATVVCDFKNGIFKAYVNGVLVQTTDNLRAGNLRALYAGNNVFFGALNDTPQYGLNCSLADIRIYPRALTASEVQQLADASLKKITNIKSGSSDVRQIFSNGEMIYAKTNDYSLNL